MMLLDLTYPFIVTWVLIVVCLVHEKEYHDEFTYRKLSDQATTSSAYVGGDSCDG